MTAATDPGEDLWGRRRLLAALVGAVAAAVAVLLGLGFAVYLALEDGSSPVGAAAVPGDPGVQENRGQTPGAGPRYRDQVAAAVMLATSPQDAAPGTPAAVPAQIITVPPATAAGPAGVPTGFPRTPEGAVGQLAAIETTVLTGMSIAQVNQVHAGWALRGAVSVPQWEMTRNVQTFLGRAGMRDQLDLTATVTAVPAAAQVKGTDGPDWVLACVLLEVRASITADASIGYGYCERMQWSEPDRRWMIGPGPAPARAPSTWPGTDRAAEAGWRTWTDPNAEQAPDQAEG